MKEFIKRNLPVFIIGLVTLVIFVAIIIAASFTQKNGPQLEKISREEMIAPYTPTKGNKDAKVVLVEFADFQCPACKSAQPMIKQILEKYGANILFAYKHFPLPQHEFAQISAIAGQAAHAQGKFWEYADILYANQPNLSKADLIKYAEQAGLDVEIFKKDLENPKFEAEVAADNSLALKLGLTGTPSFILDNTLISVTSMENFEKQIVDEINKMGVAITTETTKQTTQSTAEVTPVINKDLTKSADIIDVEYTTVGFRPNNIKAKLGQSLRWTNKTKVNMQLVQLIRLYPELDAPKIIRPEETYTLKLTQERLWTFKELDHRHYGSVFVVTE